MTTTDDSPEFPSCTIPAASRSEVFLRYLDYFRSRLIAKVTALHAADQRSSLLPSGWTPLELVKHLRYMERRWLVWGFEGEAVSEPWGDRRDDRWHVDAAETADDLIEALREQGETTRAVIERHDLAEIGQPSQRWAGRDPASMERVLFHMLQEYARHVGHIDIVCELAVGQQGE